MAERLVPALRRTPDELGNLLGALAGRHVPAGPSGAPTRGMAHVLPTGRNFYAIDPNAVPSPLAWEVGRALAERLVERHVAESDVVITTALIPGRPAPRLITAAAVASMRAGSVIVDLAAETGGNCELTEPGETVIREGVTIAGPTNLPSTMADHASSLYARNVQSMLELMVGDEGELSIDFDDEIIKGACITHEGEIVHEGARNAAGVTA